MRMITFRGPQDVWLRHWVSDFMVLEVESHEGSNLKGEDVRVDGK